MLSDDVYTSGRSDKKVRLLSVDAFKSLSQVDIADLVDVLQRPINVQVNIG
jgi:hypothetical protein